MAGIDVVSEVIKNFLAAVHVNQVITSLLVDGAVFRCWRYIIIPAEYFYIVPGLGCSGRQRLYGASGFMLWME